MMRYFSVIFAFTAATHGSAVPFGPNDLPRTNSIDGNILNDFHLMQKFFEDHLQEALQDQSKRLAQLESSRMKGCDSNDFIRDRLQRLTERVQELDEKLNATLKENQDLKTEKRNYLNLSRRQQQRRLRRDAATFDDVIEEDFNSLASPKTVIAFDAYRNQPFYEAQSILTFNGTTVNIGNAFDPQTGKFVAPLKGVYSFSFHGLTYDGTATHIKIMKNNENVGGAYRRHEGEGDEEHESLKAGLKKAEGMLAQSILLELEKDDEVAIFAYHGNLRDGAWHYTHFTGHLL